VSSDNPPEDSRPRPQYGELAPEGWTWEPPKDDHVEPDPTSPAPPPPASPTSQGIPTSPNEPATGKVPTWDRPATLGLLIFGLLATFFTIAFFTALPEQIQIMYTQQDLGTYKPASSVPGLLTVGGISQAVLWLVTAGVSALLMLRGRRAFYVPLIGGGASVVILFVFASVVLATDPTLLEFIGRR